MDLVLPRSHDTAYEFFSKDSYVFRNQRSTIDVLRLWERRFMARKKSRKLVVTVLLSILVIAGAGIYGVTVLSRPATDIDPSRLVTVERSDIARSVVAIGRIEPVRFKYRNRQVGIVGRGTLKLKNNLGGVFAVDKHVRSRRQGFL